MSTALTQLSSSQKFLGKNESLFASKISFSFSNRMEKLFKKLNSLMLNYKIRKTKPSQSGRFLTTLNSSVFKISTRFINLLLLQKLQSTSLERRGNSTYCLKMMISMLIQRQEVLLRREKANRSE